MLFRMYYGCPPGIKHQDRWYHCRGGDHDKDGVVNFLDYDWPHLRNADHDGDGIRNIIDHDWPGYKWVNPRGDHDGDNVMNFQDPDWSGTYGLKEHYQNIRKKSNSHTPHEQDPQGYQQAALSDADGGGDITGVDVEFAAELAMCPMDGGGVPTIDLPVAGSEWIFNVPACQVGGEAILDLGQWLLG